MAESPVAVILEMISFLVQNTAKTMGGIIGLFGDLLGSLGVVSEVGGPLGFGLSVAILAVVGLFIAKILFGGGKKLIILIPVGIILVYLLVLGSLV